ncbi:MAG TPA: phosphatidate cytidylyltransferase [Acetobacteraceae bacterium]|nr:phosphatidate cytidylyltransferase [Acetobacteraceae bacterium]
MADGLAERASGPPARRPWRDLRARVASALVLVPVALGAIWVGGPFFAGVIAALALGLAYEWMGLCRAGALGSESRLGGVFVIALWAAALLWLRGDPEAGRANVIGLALVVWGSDIGAYVAGRLIGGPRLAPRVSPSKTWAGAAGGALASALISVCAAKLLVLEVNVAAACLLGAGFSVIGQAGDLAESAVKRRCGMKDSGRLIPGHGGLLDRLDASLAVAPVAAVLSLALGRGVVLWQ